MANPRQNQPVSGDMPEINFHLGNMLFRAASTYPSLMRTLIECVQNAIDGQADRIFVGIDLKNRRVDVADNGEGVAEHVFNRALGSVGQTIKDSGKLGRFGLGLISPLNKCALMTFTSSSIVSTGRRSNRWTFDTKKLKQQSENLSIDRVSIDGMPALGRMFKPYVTPDYNVLWRTVVSMTGVIQDKVVTLVDLDSFEGEMLGQLGNEMRSRSIKVLVVLIDGNGKVQSREVTANAFTGDKLKPVHYLDPDAGEVDIELYRAPRRSGKRSGRVSVMETGNPSTITMANFANQARRMAWKVEIEPVIHMLSTGYFEGTIRASGITMLPERTKFEKNDALKAFHFILALWYEDHGKAQFENEQEESRENRYQELGIKSQERLKGFFQDRPDGIRLLDALRSRVTFGRLGDGHSKPSSGKLDGLDGIGSVRTGQGGAGKGRPLKPPAGSTPPKAPSEPKVPGPDRPGDTPFGAMGPQGDRRQLIKGDSQGLWFEHSRLSSNSHLWEFDLEQGVLTFNVRHHIWVGLDETNGKHTPRNAKWIMTLQEWLTLEVLHLLLMYPEPRDFDEHRSLIDDKMKLYVDMFIV